MCLNKNNETELEEVTVTTTIKTEPQAPNMPPAPITVVNTPTLRKARLCLKLVRSLHGLKSSPKHWAHLLSKTLLEAGYTQSDYDPCLYFHKCAKTDKEVYIACYVDDLLATGDQGFIDDFVRFLESK